MLECFLGEREAIKRKGFAEKRVRSGEDGHASSVNGTRDECLSGGENYN
jgi:hypothetical protein